MSIRRPFALWIGLGVVSTGAAWGQAPPTTAKVDVSPLDLTDPDRYQLPAMLEAVRRVSLVATTDAVVRTQDAKAGATVRESQEIVQLDRGEASARLKIAQADLKEAQALLAEGKSARPSTSRPRSSSKPASKRPKQRGTRADRPGSLHVTRTVRRSRADFPVSDGQYVAKGTVLAEIADVSSLRVLLPVRHTGQPSAGR